MNGSSARPRGPRSSSPGPTGARAPERLSDLDRDVRLALRGLGRAPAFVLVAVATIALGTGATTAMMSLANAVLVRPPPIAEPERVRTIWEERSDGVTSSVEGRLLPPGRLAAYREGADEIFEDVAGHAYGGFSLVTDDGAVVVDGFRTSSNYFTLLGLVPSAGRLYDDETGSVVLSHRLWTTRFAADPEVVGRTLDVDGRPFTVVGVGPPGFVGTMATFTGDLWVPSEAYAVATGSGGIARWLVPIGRLRDGIEVEVARARLDAIAPTLAAQGDGVVRGARLEGLAWRGDQVGLLRLGFGSMLAAAGLLLVIACVNIAGMVVVRAHDRRREIAVRRALGAGRGRIVRQLLIESLVLALLGGVGGVALARVGTAALSAIRFPVGATVTLDATPDAEVLAVSLLVATLAGVAIGLGPALRASGVDLSTALKEGARGPSYRLRRRIFVLGQIALVTVLLVSAGLFARSLRSVRSAPLGFDPEGVVVATMGLGSLGYDNDRARTFFTTLAERAAALPGVESVGLGVFVPLGGASAAHDATAAEGGETGATTGAYYNRVDHGFFQAMGVELIAGRFFDESDASGSPVAVVNEAFAERLWPDRSSLGRRFSSGGVEREVVGVVRDGVYVVSGEPRRSYAYYPLPARFPTSASLVVRASVGAEGAAAAVRALVAELEGDVGVELRTMAEAVTVSRLAQTLLSALTGLFAGIGLLLAALGIYGLLAVQVARQGRELAVRMALGARALDVRLLVLGRGLGLAVPGCALGLLASYAGGRALAALLYRVEPVDLSTFVSVPSVLIVTAVLASLLPAARATRVSPAVTLREE